MQFKVDDFVVHPAYGIGQIVKIEEKQFSEKGRCLYYKISLSGRTVWVPVETEQTSRFRPVTAGHELDRYRNVLKSEPVPLNKNHHQRHRELLNRLKEGSFKEICEVVRDLTARSWQKPLGPTDTATLQKTRESLYAEWAAAASISRADAIKEVESLLQTTQLASAG